jgi:hypothetical protein
MAAWASGTAIAAVGKIALSDIVGDYLDLLATPAAVLSNDTGDKEIQKMSAVAIRQANNHRGAPNERSPSDKPGANSRVHSG